MNRVLCGVVPLFALTGCSLFRSNLSPVDTPPTAGEKNSGYAYIPLDPLPVQTIPGDSCKYGNGHQKLEPLLDALPDNAVRMLVERVDASGTVSYLVSKAAGKGQSYRITVDYIDADTDDVPVWIAKELYDKVTKRPTWVDPIAPVSAKYKTRRPEYFVTRAAPKPADAHYHKYFIPVYIGIGLRVSANVFVTSVNANISGIGEIGAEASADKLTGSLTVQTLGINGKSVAAALPIQSDLNQTTAQNAITAVASIKTLLYSTQVIKSPRVVGLYLPFNGGPALVNALISALATKRILWHRPCIHPWVEVPASTERQKVPNHHSAARKTLRSTGTQHSATTGNRS